MIVNWGDFRVRVSPFQGFICKTYSFIRVFPAENKRFEGPDRAEGKLMYAPPKDWSLAQRRALSNSLLVEY